MVEACGKEKGSSNGYQSKEKRRKVVVPWTFDYSRSFLSTKSSGVKDDLSKVVGEDRESSGKKGNFGISKISVSNDDVQSFPRRRKVLAPWRFQQCRWRLQPETIGFSKEELPKSSKKVSCAVGEELSRSPQTPEDGSRDCARGGEQAERIETVSSLAKKELLTSPEAEGSQKPRRYPLRVRNSAAKDYPNVDGTIAVDLASKGIPNEEVRSNCLTADNDKKGVESWEKKRKKDGSFESSKGSSSHIASLADQVACEPVVHDISKDVVARGKVKEWLNEFKSIYRKLVEEDQSRQNSRCDLVAFKLFREKNKGLDEGRKYLGNVPGIFVGDAFHLRVELHIVGLHRQHSVGIDSIKQGEKSIAISIVSFERCADAGSLSDVFEYSCYGLPNEGLKLYGGHLALQNAIHTKTPVRVIYGFLKYRSKHSTEMKTRKLATYIYDGLYLVEKLSRKKDDDNQYLFTFLLRRMPGQPKVDIEETLKLSSHHGLYIADITEGKEKIPISVVNDVDDEDPPPYKYITKLNYPSQHLLAPIGGCDCVNGCPDSNKCACAVKNGGELPFNIDRAIIHAKPLVYECGPSCKCSSSCHNRVSQHGIKFRLQIFKTKSMGWGVRSLDFIPSGSFVCEYLGEILKDEEADHRATDDYLFSVGNNYYDESLWEGLSASIPALEKGPSCKMEEIGFTIDASKFGNVGRFINHNCTPNLYAQNLLYDHDEMSMPHITFFASEDIPPLQELSYHYNYTIDAVRDSNGNIKKKNCYCGSTECTGRLY